MNTAVSPLIHPSAAARPAPAKGATLQEMHWTKVEALYTAARRELRNRPDWRQSPARVLEVAKEGFEAVTAHGSLTGRRFCDLGCGVYHPFGVSAVMFINGAESTLGLDLNRGDPRRAAEALADLLIECLAFPDRWHWGTVTRDEFIERIRRFDLGALQQGNLPGGIGGLPVQNCITDIHHPSLPEKSFDFMSSRAVLEHFLDFGRAADRLFALMRPGGVAFHLVDIVDHRAYEGRQHHFWSFLAEDETWSDGVVNRLRSCEIRPHFERAGFEILSYENDRGKMPAGFLRQVSGRFKTMPVEELSVTTVRCVLRRPA